MYILNNNNLYKGVYTFVYMETKKEQKRITLTKEEVSLNLKKLQEDVMTAYDTMKKIIPEKVIEKEVTAFGNSAHIVVPKEYAKKKAIVIIKK